MYEVTVKNGVTIPQLGLGVFRNSEGEETENAVHWALEAGWDCNLRVGSHPDHFNF